MHEKKYKQIGRRIKELRKQAGYTSYENFALDHDFNRMTIYRAEAGKTISLRTLFNIMDKLGVTMEEFFDGLK